MALPEKQKSLKKSEHDDNFVLDVESLLNSNDKELISNSRISRNLSRKGGSLKNERKAATNDDTYTPKGKDNVGTTMPEKSVMITVGIQTETVSNPNAHKLVRRSSFVDPGRRIFLFFASLSTMGTILLIYLTVSMNRISGDDQAAA